MKQQGATWITADGKETLKKFIPPHIQLHEKLVQKIAGIAVHMEENLRQTRVILVNACREALRNNPDKSMKTRFTYTSFDNEYKVEFDLQTEHVRIYQATKKNPGSKDYRLVDLNITSVKAELGDWDNFIKGIGTNEIDKEAIKQVATEPTPGEHTLQLAPTDGQIIASPTLQEHPGMMPPSVPTKKKEAFMRSVEDEPIIQEEIVQPAPIQRKKLNITTVEDMSPSTESAEVFKDPGEETPELFK